MHAGMEEDDELALEALEDDDDDEGSTDSSVLLENVFGVDDVDGRIVLKRRPPARIEQDAALNLAAWIVAATGVDFHDFEELVRSAVEGR